MTLIDLSVTISGAAPEQVYEVLTDGVKFGEVTGQPGKGGGAPGAYYSLFDGWLEGRQVELVPNERISQAWRFADWEPGVYSMVRFTLSPAGHGTRLAVHQNGVPEEMREHIASNWPALYFQPIIKHFAAPSGLRAADGLHVIYVLRAPTGQVWDALTDTEKFGFWFGAQLEGVFTDAAELTGRQVPTQAHPGLGRAMKPYLGTTFSLSVDQFEPNRLLAFRWQPVTDATGAAYPAETATLVSFALAEADGVTNLTVTESALRDDPRLWRPRELAMLVEKFLSGARDLRPITSTRSGTDRSRVSAALPR